MTELKLNYLQIYPLGDAAIVVQFGEVIDQAIHTRVQNFANYLECHPFRELIEYVPAYTTVTIYYNPIALSGGGRQDPYGRILNIVQNVLLHSNNAIQAYTSREVIVPVCYGGDYGPDLAFVARHNQLTPEEVISIHTNGSYQVYMIGFAPGFPYLGGLDERIAAPRKETPRPVIPAGTIGIAGKQTGIYSIETPGGWQLIGRTPLLLFNPARQQPSLLQAGDRVKFIAITPEEFQRRKEQQHEH